MAELFWSRPSSCGTRRSNAITLVVDPRAIVDATRESLAFEVEIGDFPTAPTVEGLFDPSWYVKATGAG